MLFLRASLFSFAASALAYETTITELKCRTRLGSKSVYEVPTQTTTKTIISAPVTVEFNDTRTITVTPERLHTFENTVTSISTVNSTITQTVTDSIWTTTFTKYVDHGKTVNRTVWQTTGSTVWTTTTVEVVIPTPDGFKYINETAPATTETSSSEATQTAAESKTEESRPSESQGLAAPDFVGGAGTVYIIKDGKLMAADMEDLRAAEMSFAEVTNSVMASDATGASASEGTATSATATATEDAGKLVTEVEVQSKTPAAAVHEGPTATEDMAAATDPPSSADSDSAAKADDVSSQESEAQDSGAKATGDDDAADTHAPEYKATFHRMPRLPKRDLEERKLAKREYQKETKGLRGVMLSNVRSASVAFPTLVECK